MFNYAITSDCSCVKAEYDEVPVPPKGAVDVQVSVAIPPGKAQMHHRLSVYAKDTEPLILDLHVDVSPEVTAVPAFLVFDGPDTGEAEITFKSLSSRIVEGIEITNKPSSVTVEILPGVRPRIKVQIPKSAKDGIYVIAVLLKKSGDVCESLSIPVTIRRP